MSAAVGPILYRTSISRESRLRHPEGKRVLLNIAPSPAPKLALNAGNPARARGAIESSVGRGERKQGRSPLGSPSGKSERESRDTRLFTSTWLF